MKENVRLSVDCLVNGELDTNTYFIKDTSKNTLIVDPADGEEIIRYIEKEELIPRMIVNTHGHYDHISGNLTLKNRYDIPICSGLKDFDFFQNPDLNLSYFIGKNYISPEPDITFDEKESFDFSGEKINIIWTPGHTPGSITLIFDDIIVSGDLLFKDGVGRTDLIGGDPVKLIGSLKKIFTNVPSSHTILPGHGFYGKAKYFKEILKEFKLGAV